MTLGFVLAVLYTLGWIPLFFIRTEALSRAFPLYGRGERWSTVCSAVFMGAHMTAACVVVSLTASIAPTAAILSVATFATGIGFWLWARMLISPLRSQRLPDEPPLRLQFRGPFGLVRHPLYLGGLTAAAAPLFVAPRPGLFLTYALCLVSLAVRAVQEERRLHEQLGPEYAAYCRAVKRLVPFVW
jgi:protein-S-isoprenylcysteine O-methyltransferase Ste14